MVTTDKAMQCCCSDMPLIMNSMAVHSQADLENHQTYVTKRDSFFSRHLMPEEVKINVRHDT